VALCQLMHRQKACRWILVLVKVLGLTKFQGFVEVAESMVGCLTSGFQDCVEEGRLNGVRGKDGSDMYLGPWHEHKERGMLEEGHTKGD
jgi:hypothetical protein